MVETINKLVEYLDSCLRNMAEPTPEEIAKEMDISEEKVRDILKIAQDSIIGNSIERKRIVTRGLHS